MTSDQIAARAFELYRQRGYQNGYDVEDWLEAERQLIQEGAATLAAAGVTGSVTMPPAQLAGQGTAAGETSPVPSKRTRGGGEAKGSGASATRRRPSRKERGNDETATDGT